MLLSRATEIVLKLLNLPPFKGYRLMSGDTLNRLYLNMNYRRHEANRGIWNGKESFEIKNKTDLVQNVVSIPNSYYISFFFIDSRTDV